MIVTVLLLFLTVPLVGLHCVIVVFPDHTHLIFCSVSSRRDIWVATLTLFLIFSLFGVFVGLLLCLVISTYS